MFKHRKLIVFTVLVMTLILSIGAISAADDTSTSDMDNSNVHTTSESITNENLVSDTQDNNIEQSTPKSIKTDTDNTISINKDNYREHGWIKENDEGKYALSYNGEQNPGNVTFIFEDTIDENLNSIALLNTNNTAITANPDVEFNNIAFTLENTNNVTLKDLKIDIDENYVYTWIYNPNIIHVDSESTSTTIDNVHMNCILPPTTDLPFRFNVLDIQSGAEIIDSEFIIETYSSEVDWTQGSEYYGTNQIMPIRTRGESSVNFKNNRVYINATNNNTQFPTLYGITFETPYSIISNNYMEIHGNGWLYAINIKADYCNVTNNEIIVTGTNYTGGIFIQDHSYNLVDNNTITLEADVERVEGANTEPVTYGIVLENYAYTGATYREGLGHVANNTISNNQITCTANNMYAIEQFGGDNTTIINNTMESTGETAMGIGIIGANSIISNNDITVTGTKETGVTVDYLTAKTAGIVTTRGFNARITENTISSTFSGIFNTGEINDIIEDNIITCTGDYAIKLQSCNYTTVTNNYLVANEEVGDNAVLTNTQTNTIENNMPLPELIETEITITTEIPEEVELYDLLDIEGYFTANGVKCNFDSIEIFDNGGSLEVIESWDSEGGIYYTYDVEEVGEHELSFVFNGNDTHMETERILLFNVYDPDEKKDSFIDFSLDDSVESGEELEISALMYAVDDDETPISDAIVLIKVIINDEVVHENQTITDEEGWILYSFDTTGLSGLAKVELIFEGNNHYKEIYTSEEIEIIGNKQDVIIMLSVDDEYVEGEDITVDGTVFTMDDEEAVTGLDITINVTYSDGTSTSTTVTTDDEGSFTAQLPANVLGEATITASIAENDLYNTANASETTEIIQKPAVPTLLVIDAESPVYSGETLEIAGQLVYYDENQDEHAITGANINVKITIGNEFILEEDVTTDQEGILQYTYDTTGNVGTGMVTLTFDGTDDYLEASASQEVEILPAKKDVIILLEPDESYPDNETITLTGEVIDEDNTPLTDKTITVMVTFSDETTLELSGVTEDDGSFTITIPQEQLVLGSVTITATTEESEEYNEATTEATTEVIHEYVETAIDYEAESPIKSSEGIIINAVLHEADDEEAVISGEQVSINIAIGGGVSYITILTVNVTTGADGSIYYEYDTTDQKGTFLIDLNYDGNSYYAGSSATQEVEIIPDKKDVIILLEPDESYPDNETITLTGEVIDEDNTPLTDKTITVMVTFSDETTLELSGVTEDDGSFTITIPQEQLVLGSVTITATTEESEEYNEATTEVTTEVIHEQLETFISYSFEDSIFSGEELEITALLYDADDTAIANVPVTVRISIDDEIVSEEIITTNQDGTITCTFDTTGFEGIANVEIIFDGNYDYLESSASDIVEILPSKKDVMIMVEIDDEYTEGDEIEVYGILSLNDDDTPVVGQTITVTITYSDGTSLTVESTPTDEEGYFTATLPANVIGQASITASISDNEQYNDASDTTTTEIVKTPLETSMTVDTESTIYSGDTLEIDGMIIYTDNEDNEYALANAPVILKITIDDVITLETTVTTDNEGMISYQFDTTGIDGNALVELIFEGNEDYMASSDNQEVLIKPARKEVTILLECDESYPDNDDMILSGIAYTADDNELPVIDTVVYITVTFDDDSVETYTPVTDNEGSFIITVSKDKLVVGNVHILASIEESDLYLESTTEAETEITHETFETLLTVDVESTVNSGDIMQIDGILLYSDEVDEYALAGVPVILKITIDDVITLETTVTTDNEGMISYQFDTTGITGNAIVELIFEGDYDYRSSSDSSAVEIVKVKKNVVMDCLILDEYAIGEEIVVSGILSVEDEQTPVEGKNVDITIAYYDGSSKTITATTDSDGVFTASFNASVLGTIQVNITSAEDDDYLEAQSELTSYINKIATSLDVNILNTTLGNVTIAVNVYDELDNPLTHGTITVKDADENLLLTVELDGETAIINVPANAEGQIKIMVEYLENDMYLPSIYINQSALETPDEYFVIIEVKGNYQESVVTLDELTAFVNNTCTISATVTDIDGNDIDTGIVEFIDGEGNILGQANVENGVASIDVLYTKELTTQVTATYTSGSEYITDSETTATLTVRKANTVIEIDDVELIAGQTVNLTARVFDEAGNNISVGKVVFKINGKTLKDANGKVLYAKVVNGTATIEYTVPDELAGAEINITATYSGNSKIPGANTTITTTVNTKGASLTLTSPEEVQVGSTATFTATINDNKVVNNGKVVFKINGKTLKDDNGKVIYARIVNNVATIEYTIPENMKAKIYNLTAVLLADEYDRLEATNEIKITN
ncbi:Ig-like domain repeat protein [Methanosphaera sp. BMS]|uniref:Ig-like domain repeat protein n=1 Tax=Methanosphaera sp. BMS TaxID=1789762 RepID=UPI000DC1CF27|nr:Ig-like domain repeat protein [Methanosphaera sp. BMS]AWX32957.1 hypothetical protein AW729_07535 [Methanosphaera sp. BMS]